MRRSLVSVVVALFALTLLAGGAFILVTQRTGAPAQATVTDCQRRGRTTVCTGTWTVGGDLTDGGRVVRGTIEGASVDLLGRTVDVRLSGDRAYTTSRRLPLVLVGCGLTVAALGAYELRRTRRPTGS